MSKESQDRETPEQARERLERESRGLQALARQNRLSQWKAAVDDGGHILIRHAAELIAAPSEFGVPNPFLEDGQKAQVQAKAQELLQGLERYITNPRDPIPERKVPLNVLLAWLREEYGEDTSALEKEFSAIKRTSLDGTPDYSVLSRYNTPLINALVAVVEEFWADYEEDVSPDPKKDEVVAWIKQRYPDIKDSMAGHIDAIARHPSLKGGGQKKRKVATKN